MARSFIAAASKIAAAIKAGKIILLVTDQIAAFPEVIKLHQESQVAYLFNSWIPGFYSNFQQIHASVQQVQHNISLLDVYNTKKERNIAQKHLNKARLRYSGIWQLQDKPDLIILCCSPQKTLRILKEVKNSEVKIISLYDCSRQSLPILTSSKLKYVYSALNSSAVQLLISIINYHLNKVDATSDK
jgi:ribosomal protein S2